MSVCSHNHREDQKPLTLGVRWLIVTSACIVASIAILAFVGWITRSHLLTAIWREAVPMNPITAVSFLFGSISCALLLSTTKSVRIIGACFGIAAAFVGASRALALLTGLDLRLDQLFFAKELLRQAIPNRMAPNTAADFILTGSALALIRWNGSRRSLLAQILALTSIGIAICAMLGYAYSASAFAQVGTYIPMAFNTACCFALLGVCVLAATKDTGVVLLLTSSTMGGQMARRLTIAITCILPIIGWFRLRAQETGTFDTANGTAMMVICSAGVLLCVVLAATNAFRKLEEKAQDIKDRLDLTEERLQTTIRGSNAGLWDWELATGEFYVAPKYLELLGYDSPSGDSSFVKFESPASMVHPEDSPILEEAITGQNDSHHPLDICIRLRCKDGGYQWFRSRGEITRDEYGDPVRLSGAVTDISELKQAEGKAFEAQSNAQKANGAKSEFLSRMSHELRTPLNAVLGFAQLIEMDVKTDQERENVEQILKAGKHLLNLIDEVLDISRIEAGKLLVSVEPVQASEVLEEVIQLMSPFATQYGITMSVVPNEVWYECLLVDRQRFKQVLLNLASNAIKYNSKNGTVTFACEHVQGDNIRVMVSDTGKGISDVHIQKLFTPFERLGAEAGSIEGTGLGLVFSKRLVELMSGTIGVESLPDEGSTFYVEFRRSQLPAIAAKPQLDGIEESSATAMISPKTVLYIEDNKPNLELVETIFKRRPYVKLISAMQGRLGIELAHQHKPDLVLLDMNLPDIDGQHVLAELKADDTTANIPVVIVSADAVTTRIEKLLDEGASAYLTKPISIADFLMIVDSALDAAA